MAGAVVLVATFVAMERAGLGQAAYGALRVLGYLAGAGLLIAGALRAPEFAAVDRPAIRWAVALVLAAGSTTTAFVWPAASATGIILGYVAAVCVLLPLGFGVATLFGIAGLHVLLTWISGVKTALTGLPLTILDVKIALANPAGLWDALALPHWTRHLTIGALVLASSCWLAAGFVAAYRLAVARTSRLRPLDAVARAALLVVVGLLIARQLASLFAEASRDKSTWRPEGVTRLAERMGVVPFVLYSQLLESKAIGDIYRTDTGATAPSGDEVRAAVLRYMTFAPAASPGSRQPPNILVVLAESTFDPGEAFRLQGAWDDWLFRPNALTAASGPLRVNSVGGGTWIAEFETIVGLDARLFGYSGMYTHASLSPFVARSFATYLRERGYRTWAFFPQDGEFYNGRRAYQHYGFERVLDRTDLGLRPWWEQTDVDIAESVRTTLGPDPGAPFYGYVLLIENHAPHDCNVEDASGFTVRLAETQDFAANCALHEYLRRIGSTTAAVRSLVAYLADLEARTGRPFVLLVFGDHLPHTFTSTGGVQLDYRPFRKQPDVHTTFFHMLSTAPGATLSCCAVAPFTAMLPTLLSGFVARGPDDIYMGMNLWLHAQCGTDAVRHDFDDKLGSLASGSTDDRSDECKNALDRALAGYRTSGVVRLGGSPGP